MVVSLSIVDEVVVYVGCSTGVSMLVSDIVVVSLVKLVGGVYVLVVAYAELISFV